MMKEEAYFVADAIGVNAEAYFSIADPNDWRVKVKLDEGRILRLTELGWVLLSQDRSIIATSD